MRSKDPVKMKEIIDFVDRYYEDYHSTPNYKEISEHTGLGKRAVYNYLTEKGAINRKVSGKYDIDYAKTLAAIESLGAEILEIQALGDYETAELFAAVYGGVPQAIQQDVVNLELEKIPVDIRFEYEK